MRGERTKSSLNRPTSTLFLVVLLSFPNSTDTNTMEGRRRTRSFLEDDHEAEENIRQLALAASLNGATAKTRGSSSGNSSSSGDQGGGGGRGRGRSTSFHVDDDDANSSTTDESSSGSDSDSSSGASPGRKKKTKSKKGTRQVSKKTLDILECRKLKEDTKKQPISAADKAEQKLREDIGRGGDGGKSGGKGGKGGQRTSPSKGRGARNGNNKKRQAAQPHDILVKILLLGDSGVGKTCLLTRFAEKKYSPSLVTTAGIDFKVQYFEVHGVKVKCQIWDTAGQERFHVITKAYYKGAHGIALVYDVTDRKSLDNIDYWLGNIADNAQEEVEQVLIANKVDLPRQIDSEEGESVAAARNIRYLETSAKSGQNVRSGKFLLLLLSLFTLGWGNKNKRGEAKEEKTNKQTYTWCDERIWHDTIIPYHISKHIA